MGSATGDRLSLQEQYFPRLTCFGCGHANPKGLRLRSYPADGYVTASFTPWPEHDNGNGFLNGGIICTLLDCHSGAAVLYEASRRGLLVDEGRTLTHVTASIDVRYLRPTPLVTVELRATLADIDDNAMTVAMELIADDKVRAAGTALWKRWRPR